MIEIAPEVAQAVAEGRPVVALETAVLTHGLPRPQAHRAMLAMIDAVTEEEGEGEGAVAAVIAVIAGRLRIGLDPATLDALADEPRPVKLGARDLAWALTTGATGGTTVSGTLVGARLAGIEVFATGGIGGVHRGWAEHRDISSDLMELSRTPCCTVSAGAKSILDIPATLEALETLGVPVLGWRTANFPEFYAPGRPSPGLRRVDELATVASLCRARWGPLGQRGGVLLAQPLPPSQALDQGEVDRAVTAAVERAAAAGIRGSDLTPALLAALGELTAGASLTANLALLVANARLGARVARALVAAQRS